MTQVARKMITILMISLSLQVFASTVKTTIYTPNAPAPIGTYSQAIKWGDTVYISGQIPIDPKTNNLVMGDFNAQARQVFINLAEIANAAGGNLEDTLKLTIYLSDLSHFSEVNQIMSEFIHEPFPARAVIEIKSLPKNAAIEIEAILGVR